MEPPPLSEWSSPTVPNSAWSSENFMLGVGMVIFQEGTNKVVLVYEKAKKYYFFPRGRKDVGEGLEQAALREAYEESGYRVKFMPHWAHTCAPPPPRATVRSGEPTSEPIFINTISYPARKRRSSTNKEVYIPGGEYIIHWYLGEISENAVRELGTGMPDEANFEAQLLSVQAAVRHLKGTVEERILRYAWQVYTNTLSRREYIEGSSGPAKSQQVDSASGNGDLDTAAH